MTSNDHQFLNMSDVELKDHIKMLLRRIALLQGTQFDARAKLYKKELTDAINELELRVNRS